VTVQDALHNSKSVSNLVVEACHYHGCSDLTSFGQSHELARRLAVVSFRCAGLAWLLATSALSWSCGAFAQAAAPSAQYCYDAAGRLIGVIDANGSATYQYDVVGNTTSVTQLPPSTLVVVDASPASAPVGQTITIYGTALLPKPRR
jgi:YD repeat-containing protein